MRVPLFWGLAVGNGKIDNPLRLIAELKSILPPDAVIVSDVPWAVAWHAERTSLWLPEIKTDDFEGTMSKGKIDAIYLSPTVLNYGESEKVEGYKKMFLGQSQPRGFEKGKAIPGLGMLFVKKRAGGEKP